MNLHATAIRETLGDAASPVAFALITNASMPVWRAWLQSFSDLAGLLGPIFAALSAVYAVYCVHMAGKKSTPTDAVKAVGQAAGAASKASPYLLVVTLLTLGGYLVYSVLTSNRAAAAPASVQEVVARKKKQTDAAGDDGDAEEEPMPDGVPSWYVPLHRLIGTSETLPNGRPNPVVQAMFPSVGLPANSDCRRIPWCAVGQNWALREVGKTGTNSAMARSFLRWGVALDTPRVGCIVVMWRGDHDDGETGHVGQYVREDSRYVYVLGCNQGDAVSIAKFPKSRVLAYRWPRSAMVSKTNIGAGVAAGASVATGAAQIGAAVLPEPAKVPAATEAAKQVIQDVQAPLEQVASMAHGTVASKYAMAGLAVLAIAGAALALYGRYAVRRDNGI